MSGNFRQPARVNGHGVFDVNEWGLNEDVLSRNIPLAYVGRNTKAGCYGERIRTRETV